MTIAQSPIEVLKNEHQAVLKKLESLENNFNRLDEREAISAELTELISFFDTDFWIHFTKEEEALFPEMEGFMPRESGPIRVMLLEHEELRGTNDKLQLAVREYLGGSDAPETKTVIRGLGKSFIDTLRSHIDKEDNILFNMAEAHLAEPQLAAIIGRFHQLDPAG